MLSYCHLFSYFFSVCICLGQLIAQAETELGLTTFLSSHTSLRQNQQTDQNASVRIGPSNNQSDQ